MTLHPNDGWTTPVRPGWTTSALRAMRRWSRRRPVRLMFVALAMSGSGALVISNAGNEGVVADSGAVLVLLGILLGWAAILAGWWSGLRELYLAVRDARRDDRRIRPRAD